MCYLQDSLSILLTLSCSPDQVSFWCSLRVRLWIYCQCPAVAVLSISYLFPFSAMPYSISALLTYTCWLAYRISHHTTTTVLRPFFRYHPGEPVPEENFWTLWCKERLTEADAGRHSIRTNQYPPPPSPIFYGPDALPAAQPTVSRHWRYTVYHSVSILKVVKW